jgi:hypothetical protein
LLASLLISDFERSNPEVWREALEARATVRRITEQEYVRIHHETLQKGQHDAGIQQNGLVLTREHAKTLTREERLEVYRRSLA